MLLVIDVGNTNTVLGVYELNPPGFVKPAASGPRMIAHWRVATIKTHTVDEYGVLFRNLFAVDRIEAAEVRGIIISSVVPPMDSTLREMCERYFHLKPLFVEPGVKTGMPVHYDNPSEVGADRIVNGVAAFEKYGGPCVVVDFGTATTFDAVSKKGEYLGGVIAPGIGISAQALFEHTARLPLVDIRQAEPRAVALADPRLEHAVERLAGDPEAVVPDGHPQATATDACADDQPQGPIGLAVLDRVLDERLDEERRQPHLERLRRRVDLHPELGAEAGLLEREVALDVAQLLRQRHELAGPPERPAAVVGEGEH